MSNTNKNESLISSILNKFDISELNPMQEETGRAIRKQSDVVLLSPTGTGKTLAFLLPLVESLDRDSAEIQILIIVPSRELAQQLLQVALWVQGSKLMLFMVAELARKISSI